MNSSAKEVFEYLIEYGKSSKSDIIRNTNLSRAMVNKGINQLKFNLLVVGVEREGRSKLYWFTQNGARLIELL